MEDNKGNVTGDFGMGAIVATCKRCQTCKYAHGDDPWADAPNKCNCEMYPPENGEIKPTEVYCFYYEAK